MEMAGSRAQPLRPLPFSVTREGTSIPKTDPTVHVHTGVHRLTANTPTHNERGRCHTHDHRGHVGQITTPNHKLSTTSHQVVVRSNCHRRTNRRTTCVARPPNTELPRASSVTHCRRWLRSDRSIHRRALRSCDQRSTGIWLAGHRLACVDRHARTSTSRTRVWQTRRWLRLGNLRCI